MGLAETTDTVSETVVTSADASVPFNGDTPNTAPIANPTVNEEVPNKKITSTSHNDVPTETGADNAHCSPPASASEEDLELVGKKLDQLKSTVDRLRQSLESLTSGEKITEAEASSAPKEKEEEVEYSQLSGRGVFEFVCDFTLQVFKQPDVFVRHYTHFAKELLNIVQNKSVLAPERGDRRFRDGVWQENVVYRMVLQSYLAWSDELHGLVEDLKFSDEGDEKRASFLVNQLVDAISPSNSLLNPVAVKRAYQTGGQSVLQGLRNLLQDVKSNSGMPRQVNENAYEVGKDLACSPGAVVYRSPLFELIQYNSENSSSVYQRPVLIVPPQINRFYIFDLAEKNSLIKHLLASGMQVFVVSWKNPGPTHSHWGLDTYIKELDKGIDAVCEVTHHPDISLVSACAGGITSVAMQAYQKAIGKTTVHNHTVLVTALSAAGHPTLDLFVNRNAVKNALARTQQKGVMEGKDLAHIFAWLRPKDLVWSYWVNNNLLGKEPPTMDVLFWDNDSTRLPANLHRDFINVLLNDRFASGNAFNVDGIDIDISQLEGDFYILAGDEDYLMPWKNCYRNMQLLPKANCEFVLSDSGHIQSVLRPPGIGNTRYYTSNTEAQALSPSEWLAESKEHRGSWWGHWAEWLQVRAGETKLPPTQLGCEQHPPLCQSPGTYVFEN